MPAVNAASTETRSTEATIESNGVAKKPRRWNPPRLPPRAVVPKHVQHCNGIGATDWWIYTWRRNDPTKVRRAPYHCCSWRCPACARHEASVVFARIKEAFTPLEVDGTIFMVLTLDRDGTKSGKPWKDETQAYRELSRMSRLFLKRVNRYCKARGWKPVGNKWVATVEAHKSGWPHVNFMMHCPELALELERQRMTARANGATHREATLLQDELLQHATASGWGVQCTAERARSVDALAGYVTKLAGKADRTTAELAKLSQAPLNAPIRFRRLRSGKGFLPPRRFDPEVTGTLVRRRREYDGTVLVLPLHEVAADSVATVAACCYREEEIAHEELRLKSVVKVLRHAFPGLKVGPPIVSVWSTRRAVNDSPEYRGGFKDENDANDSVARPFGSRRARRNGDDVGWSAAGSVQAARPPDLGTERGDARAGPTSGEGHRDGRIVRPSGDDLPSRPKLRGLGPAG
jgi:hypothetical protein